MGKKIKKVREKLDAIAADKAHLILLPVRVRDIHDDESMKIRETSSFILEGEVIGRDDDKKAIIDFLLDTKTKKDNVEVVSIVGGMGGLGKTALAQSVYNDKKINKHFQLKLWVCISEEFDVKTLVEKIIESIEEKKPESLQLDKLQSMLQEKINGKKYLLVMDDVWNESHEKWISLKRFLMGGAKGSKILITTRSEQVAQASDTVSLHRLKKLDSDNSWALFRKMAFLNEEEEFENSNLKVTIGKEIATKLKDSPLAIKIIGRHLYFKKTDTDWLSFTIMQQQNEIQSILRISFNHLPSNLKQCFTYCALFPKDYKIEKDELILRWMSLGFIEEPHDKKSITIEEVGDNYFKELLGRSFFQDVIKNEWGDIKGCKMHDFIHDLACLIVENEYVVVNDGIKSVDKRTRHVLFSNNKGSISRELIVPKSFIDAKSLRTLDIINPHVSFLSVKKIYLNNIFRLRTLNLNYCCYYPRKFIGKLKHLRYLNLSGLRINFLPNFISKLYNLETFILRHCIWLRELPRDINNLINLRHLDIYHCNNLTHMPKGLGGMTNLQTMNLFVLGKDKGGDLSELNGLKSLRGSLCIRELQFCTVTGLENVKYFEEKSRVQELELHWNTYKYKKFKIDDASDEVILECLKPHSNVRNMIIKGYRGMKLCDWLSSDFLSGLVSIELSHCEKLQYLPQFSQFPYLKDLRFINLPNIQYIIDNNSYTSLPTNFFPSLEKLSIHNMPKLKGWWKETIPSAAILHHLSKLWIYGCPQLASIPQHPPLESLNIKGVSVQLFDMVITMATNPVVDSSSNLPKLSTLAIGNIDLELLPEELFCNMKHLEILSIHSCENLQMKDDSVLYWKELPNLHTLHLRDISKLEYLPKGLKYMAALETLELKECGNLLSTEWIGQLTSLSSLDICNCPKLTLLSEDVGQLISLSWLSICNCPNLTSLPEGVSGLTSLSYLRISDCSNLRSLPEGLRQIHSLRGSLYVSKCPKLRKSY